ncbi:MAG: DUF1460 domain-containing protein [Deltaproteobacteria bacterium]|nr:DUF1460 domain-containing protein [Deltaproteobacteria bacterium]
MNVVVVVVAALVGAYQPPTDAQVGARVHTAGAVPLAARLVEVTQPFLDAPYVLSPLGEGAGVDPDPRLRFDAFDCTTFVETAMALALASDLDDARVVLDHIRYKSGVVDYAARRHFPEAEWIPQLVTTGLLVDVTRTIGGAAVTSETKKLDVTVWRKAKHEGLPKLDDARIPAGVFALDVWRLDDAALHADLIPAGTILHLVRVDFANVPVRVSHQGLVLEKDGKKFIRHAADRMHHRVVDEPLDRFFSRMKQYGKWPVTGVHLTQFAAPADWRARLGMR